MAAITVRSESSSVALYIRAKDENRPELMRSAFAEDATLEMVVNTGAITFPPFTQGVSSITDVLVIQFNRSFENVRTFCLADPPKLEGAAFSCPWLVGMSERGTGAVRVGCGTYDWSFQPHSPHLASRLRIAIEEMEVLPSKHLAAVVNWLSELPHPWCNGPLTLRGVPSIEQLEPIIRYLEQVKSEDV